MVSAEDLRTLLRAAWIAAQQGSYELKEEVLDETLADFLDLNKKPWKMLSFQDWLALPAGQKVFHSLFGEGFVAKKGEERFVGFHGFRMELQTPGWPWDLTVQVL